MGKDASYAEVLNADGIKRRRGCQGGQVFELARFALICKKLAIMQLFDE